MTQELLAKAKTLAEKIDAEQVNIMSLECFLQKISGTVYLDFSNHGSHCSITLLEHEAREIIAQFMERLKRELQDTVTQFGAL